MGQLKIIHRDFQGKLWQHQNLTWLQTSHLISQSIRFSSYMYTKNCINLELNSRKLHYSNVRRESVNMISIIDVLWNLGKNIRNLRFSINRTSSLNQQGIISHYHSKGPKWNHCHRFFYNDVYQKSPIITMIHK